MFGFNKSPTHGFPNKPTCVAWDPELKLLVLGTRTGGLRLFGQPGVELVGQAVVLQQAQLLGGQAQERGAEPLVGLHMFLQVVLHAVCSGNNGATIRRGWWCTRTAWLVNW